MAWEKLYQLIGWKNKNEMLTTPLGATLLNRMDNALNEIDNRVIELNKQKAAAGDLDNMITNVSYNKETGVITFTKYSGSVQSFDLSDYISNIEVLVNKASASATTASQKASEATASATSASESAVSAKEDAERAELAAKNAEAVSGVGIATETTAGLMAGGDNAVSEDGTLLLTKTTTDRTLLKSHAGGLKINRVNGGSQQKQYSGKNLIDFADTIIEAGTNNYAFKSAAIASVLKPNTMYTFSLCSDFTSKIDIRLVNTSASTASITKQIVPSNGRLAFTFITPEDLTNYQKILIYAGVQGSTAGNNVKIWNVQLELSDMPTDYEPYVGGTASPNPDYPQDINSVEVSQVKAVGKNVLNPSLLTNLSVAFNEDKKTFSVIANADKKAFYQTTFKENTAYTISGYVMHTLYNYAGFTVWYTDGTFTSYPNACGVKEFKYVSFTTDATKTVDYIGVRYWSGTCSYKELQIEEGSTATPYEPYQENTINLSSPVTLRGIGDIKDKIIKKDGVFGIERNVEEVVFDGSDDEVWAKSNSRTGAFYMGATSIGGSTKSTAEFICSHALFINVSEYTVGYCSFDTSDNTYSFWLSSENRTLDDFKTWLASNNVTVVYMLATPVFEALPDADQIALHQLETFDTVTYISTDSEIEPVIEVEYGTSKAGAYALKGMLTAEANALQIAQLNTLTNELATQLV